MKLMMLAGALMFSSFAVEAQVVNETPVREIKGLKSRVTHFSMNPRENRLIVGFGKYAAMYDYDKGKKMTTFEHDMNGVNSVYYTEYHPEMDFMLTCDYKGKKVYWDANTGKKAGNVRGATDFGPDNRGVIGMGFDNNNPDNKYYYIQTEAQIPGTTIVARSTNKGTIQFIDTAADDKVVQELKFPDTKDDYHMYPCWVTPDGKYFVTGTDTGTILFYELK